MTEINQDKRYKYIFDEILTLTDDGFVVVDNHDVITDINEQYCQYLKTTREYAIGRSIAEIIPNTKMIDIVNYAYREEGAILRLSEKSDDDSDRIFLVNRSAVYDENHNVIAGVAQVKFRLQTLDSAKKLMREYSEYEFYREEYRSRNSSQYSFDKIVGNSLWTSVVAKMKTTCAGGSSSVFKRALNAETESLCTSSMIYTRYFAVVGVKLDSSMSARMLSTPLLLAASSSTTSKTEPSSSPLHTSHLPHGSPFWGSKQLTAFARIFAQVVFPVPREPVNRYACEMRPAISSFFNVTVTCG